MSQLAVARVISPFQFHSIDKKTTPPSPPNMADAKKLDANAQARFDLINENLDELMNPEIVEAILAKGENPRI